MAEENYDQELARVIDHTLLRTDAKREDFDRVCEEAMRYHFRSVCVFSGDVEYVARKLEGSDVIPIAVVGFPHGQMTPVAKAFEAHDAITNRGAREIVAGVAGGNRSSTSQIRAPGPPVPAASRLLAWQARSAGTRRAGHRSFRRLRRARP